ncbi:TPA: hypothetical protein DCW54_00365 [Candidatus Dependentiae bacterium]|nr:hypothetical protein [Candidatus Dependentiae bacterium]
MKINVLLVLLATLPIFNPGIAMQPNNPFNEQKLVLEANTKLFQLYEKSPDIKPTQKPSPLTMCLTNTAITAYTDRATIVLRKLSKTASTERNNRLYTFIFELANLCDHIENQALAKTKLELRCILAAAIKFAQTVYDEDKKNA